MTRAEKSYVFISSLLLFSTYYYLYFVDFNQGVISNDEKYAFIKFLFVFIVYSALLRLEIKRNLRLEELFFLLFFVPSVAMLLVKSAILSAGGYMFLNTVLLAVPFIIFKIKSCERVLFFFDCSVIVISLQILVDALIQMKGYSLWQNKAYVGGVGNPSSFGVICIFLISYLLHLKKLNLSNLFYVTILSYGALMTSSLLATVLLPMVLLTWGLRSPKKAFIASFAGILGISLFILSGPKLITNHVNYKLSSLFGGGGAAAAERSISVTERVNIHAHFMDGLATKPFYYFFFGSTDNSYHGVDSQFITYFGSFGFFLASFFFCGIAVMLFKAIRSGYADSIFLITSIAVFGLSFFTNRILDYFPVSILLFLLLPLMSRECETFYSNRQQS
jgi:hypothetical protein